VSLRARLQALSVAVVSMTLLTVAALDDSASLASLFVPGMIAIGLGLIVATMVSRTISSSVRELAETSRALAAGDLSARPPLSAPGELADLAGGLSRLADYLASRITAFRHEEALLTSVVEALDEGVITLDSAQRVTRINAAARTILGVTRPAPFTVDLLPRSRELRQALDSAIGGHSAEPVEATIGSRTLSIVARPLQKGEGTVLALFDLTRVKRLELIRRDFVANVSHELRTPLTVITGFAETLADDGIPAEMRQQFAATIRTHAERMRRIVDDLLDLSRLESGRWTPRSTTVDLRAIADEVANTYRPSRDELTLDTEISAGAETLFADPTAVRQILSNLVDNSLRHTESGAVTIFTERDNGGIWIGVRDTGVGIAPVHLTRIFERFYRADPGRARESGGTGLGLAIVKHLVDAHGGTVKVESEVGKGTTISAYFPD
jgi:two-component system phosphate regulon sensor histidine kinase PhoR